MEDDRRRAPRHRRLMRLEFDHDGRAVACMATDICYFGVFVNSQVVPPIGSSVTLRFTPQEGQLVVMRARVVRAVHQTLRASRIPGMAVEFNEIATVSGKRKLEQFLRDYLACPESVIEDAEWDTDDIGATVFKLPGVQEPASAARRAQNDRLDNRRTLPQAAQASQEHFTQLNAEGDRRKNSRFPIHIEVSYYVDSIPYLGKVLNISQSSLFVQTDHDTPVVGTNVTLKFPLAEAHDPQYVRIDGTVCRHWNPDTEGLAGFALQFDRVGELGRRGIFQMYLNNFRKRARKKRRGYHYTLHKR